jgi:hypothetical protein
MLRRRWQLRSLANPYLKRWQLYQIRREHLATAEREFPPENDNDRDYRRRDRDGGNSDRIDSRRQGYERPGYDKSGHGEQREASTGPTLAHMLRKRERPQRAPEPPRATSAFPADVVRVAEVQIQKLSLLKN